MKIQETNAAAKQQLLLLLVRACEFSLFCKEKRSPFDFHRVKAKTFSFHFVLLLIASPRTSSFLRYLIRDYFYI